MKSQLRCAGWLLLFFALYATSTAQTSRGTLTGIVTDSSNALVVDATVRLTETATGVSRQTTTNGAGLYRFDAVDLGTYKLTVEAKGFSTQSQTGIQIQAAHTLNIDFSLKAGSAEIVTVEANAGQVQLDTSEQTRGALICPQANHSSRRIRPLVVVPLNRSTQRLPCR